MALGPDGDLYVTGFTDSAVLRFSVTTGDFLGVFVAAGAGGLDGPLSLAFGPDGNLYVGSSHTHQVLRYNGATGAFLDAFVDAGEGGLSGPFEILFFEGSLLVASTGTDEVLRYDAATGTFLGALVTAGSGGLGEPTSLTVRGEGAIAEIPTLSHVALVGFVLLLGAIAARRIAVARAKQAGRQQLPHQVSFTR